MYCSNCNQYGHSNKKCTKPINSIGIIYKKDDKIVLVNRKYTHYYVKLLNFNFALQETLYIKTLINGLTEYEYTLITSYPYDVLWKSITMPFLIISNDNTINKTNFSSKKHRFNKLLNGYTSNGEYIKLQDIYASSSHHKYPNWELPKGKRMAYELDACAAVREFKEETGIHHEILLDETNYKDIIFRGWDGLMYSHRFYFYEANEQITLYCDSYNYVQSSEVNKCGWFTYDDIKNKQLFKGMCTEQYKSTIELLDELFYCPPGIYPLI